MTDQKLKTAFMTFVALMMAGNPFSVQAQTATTQMPNATAKLDQRAVAPQIVTVVHRLSGIKVLRMLLHSGAVSAVDTLDESFSTTREVHTNITAGLILDGGDTIAVWLPEAEVEQETLVGPFSPPTVVPFSSTQSTSRSVGSESIEVTSNVSMTPELMIIARDGSQLSARYIGWDGITGLSLLKISNGVLPHVSLPDVRIAVNQRVHLFSPEPATEGRASTRNKISVRIGETNGTIVSFRRGLGADINRVKVVAARLSKANVGGVAIDDTGRTIGIVIGIEGNEAVILPPSSIRKAVKRVLVRKGNVPRPWVGVSGESVAFAPLEGILERGWELAQARSLLKNRSGILLTSITPGSPAALASLRAGDVITHVNNSEIKSTDDFSLLLEEAGTNPLLFTIVRPNQPQPQMVSVMHGEQLDPPIAISAFAPPGPNGPMMNVLFRQGIETLPLRIGAAERLNAATGLLVIFVQPQTPAFKAGLRLSDVIESINGQPILEITPAEFDVMTRTSYSLNVIREKQKLALTVDVRAP